MAKYKPTFKDLKTGTKDNPEYHRVIISRFPNAVSPKDREKDAELKQQLQATTDEQEKARLKDELHQNLNYYVKPELDLRDARYQEAGTETPNIINKAKRNRDGKLVDRDGNEVSSLGDAEWSNDMIVSHEDMMKLAAAAGDNKGVMPVAEGDEARARRVMAVEVPVVLINRPGKDGKPGFSKTTLDVDKARPSDLSIMDPETGKVQADLFENQRAIRDKHREAGLAEREAAAKSEQQAQATQPETQSEQAAEVSYDEPEF